jgi:alkylation response protein AidB-like acyl-CoA dehydrogenase
MADYKAPIDDIEFTLKHLVKIDRLSKHDLFAEATEDLVDMVISEAAKLAENEVAPTNKPGDQQGLSLDDEGNITSPDGFIRAHQAYSEAGWGSLQFDPNFGGQGLPFSLSNAVSEMMQSANLAWGLSSLLTQGAIDAIHSNATHALKDTYLPNMISGLWSGTMNLTEPQAGSDLALLKTSAVKEGEHYLIKGQKIFITWGDNDMTENVIHLVLARLPDAPDGVKGISLFIVPKYLVDEQGQLGVRNDCKVISIEHKLGIHASPTCVMSYGDKEGAIGYLVGEEHRGLACMFTMMNNARLIVGLQGTSIAERAMQDAEQFATARKQGNDPVTGKTCTIDQHADVQRMLFTMRALTQATRAITYVGCSGVDFEQTAASPEAQAKVKARLSLLTPIIKGWVCEMAQEVTSIAVQIHGGMGFIEETGVAQHFRDARILPIYEGTTGIQAIDLVGRKTLHDKGAAFADLISEMREDSARIANASPDMVSLCAAFDISVDEIEANITTLLKTPETAASAAHDFLYLNGYTCGAWQMLLTLEVCKSEDSNKEANHDHLERLQQAATFYLKHLHPRYLGHAASLAALRT